MVPKVKADGSFSREAAEMRPITVLPEIGKILSRILAGRLQVVLVRNPSLLTSGVLSGMAAQTNVLMWSWT